SCTQVSDILPATVTINPASLPTNAVLVGDTIYWDLPNLAVGTNGVISFQAQVNSNTPYSFSFTNTAQIFSAENDQDYSDNTSTWITTTIACTPPSASVAPLSATKCPGDSITFTATAAGNGPLTYQWRKNGTNLNGATGTSLTLTPLSNAD